MNILSWCWSPCFVSTDILVRVKYWIPGNDFCYCGKWGLQLEKVKHTAEKEGRFL